MPTNQTQFDDTKFILDDHNYGKGGVKILLLVRNGNRKAFK